MAEQTAKKPDDTTEYKSHPISIPKAHAVLLSAPICPLTTHIFARNAKQTYNFWAHFWAQLTSGLRSRGVYLHAMKPEMQVGLLMLLAIGVAVFAVAFSEPLSRDCVKIGGAIAIAGC